MKSRRIILGLALVAIGVLIALTTLGVVIPPIAGVSPWKIILGAFLLCLIVDGIAKLNFFKIFLYLGFEVIVFEELIGGYLGKNEADWINNWTVVLVMGLIGFGLNLIVKNSRRSTKGKTKGMWGFSANAFSDHIEYIDCSKMRTVNIRNHFGDYDVNFENVDNYEGNGVIHIENSFGDVTVYVPSHWEVKCEMLNSFGDLNIDKELQQQYADGSQYLLIIRGNNKFGDVTIKSTKT